MRMKCNWSECCIYNKLFLFAVVFYRYIYNIYYMDWYTMCNIVYTCYANMCNRNFSYLHMYTWQKFKVLWQWEIKVVLINIPPVYFCNFLCFTLTHFAWVGFDLIITPIQLHLVVHCPVFLHICIPKFCDTSTYYQRNLFKFDVEIWETERTKWLFWPWPTFFHWSVFWVSFFDKSHTISLAFILQKITQLLRPTNCTDHIL